MSHATKFVMVSAPGTKQKRQTFRRFLQKRGVTFSKNAHSFFDKKSNTAFYSHQLATLFAWWSDGRQGEMPVVDWEVGKKVYEERKVAKMKNKKKKKMTQNARTTAATVERVIDRRTATATQGVKVTERVINSRSHTAAVEDSNTEVKRDIVKQADGSVKITEHETTKRRREEVKTEERQVYEKSVESFTQRIASEEREQLMRSAETFVAELTFQKQRAFANFGKETSDCELGMLAHLELPLKEALPRIREALHELHYTFKVDERHSWNRFTPEEYLKKPANVVKVLEARANYCKYMYPHLEKLYLSCAADVKMACEELKKEKQSWGYGLASLPHDPALDAWLARPGGFEEYTKMWRHTIDVLCVLSTDDPNWVDMREFSRRNPCPGEIKAVVGRANQFVKEDKRKLEVVQKDRTLGGFTPAEVERLCASGSTSRIRLEMVLDIDKKKLDELVGYVAGIHTLIRTVREGKIPADLQDFQFISGCEIREDANMENRVAFEPMELHKSRRGTFGVTTNYLCLKAHVEEKEEEDCSDSEEKEPLVMQLDARLLYNMFPGGDCRERLNRVTGALLKRKAEARVIPNGYEASRVVVPGTRTSKAITLPLRLMNEPEFQGMVRRLREEEMQERLVRDRMLIQRQRRGGVDPNGVMRRYFQNVDAPGAADRLIDALGDPGTRMPTVDEVAKAW